MFDKSFSFLAHYIFDNDHQGHRFEIFYNQMILLSVKIKLFLILHSLYD